MTEEFLHYYWNFKSRGHAYTTAEGSPVEVMAQGRLNTDAGPDFSDARIRIGGTLWAGNVEIHIRSSDWTRHGHQDDRAYDNVILHVVYDHDQVILRQNGEILPTLELRKVIGADSYDQYQYFLNNHLWVPCAAQLRSVRKLTVDTWLAALSVARLERKCEAIRAMLDYTANDWNQAFYQSLAATFGFRINRQPFELLARQTPVKYLEKHKDNLFQIEAVLFGQAGLLEGRQRHEYPGNLRKEYLHLKHKFSLHPIPGHLWKFLRLRPNNFPTIRLAQFAMILHQRVNLFGEILDRHSYYDLSALFRVGVSDYWKEHYFFGRPSGVSMNKTISPATLDLIIINNVVPFLFVYGKFRGDPGLTAEAVEMLHSITAESNAITRKFEEFGICAENAGQSQGLLELKAQYCDRKKCMECRFGLELIG